MWDQCEALVAHMRSVDEGVIDECAPDPVSEYLSLFLKTYPSRVRGKDSWGLYYGNDFNVYYRSYYGDKHGRERQRFRDCGAGPSYNYFWVGDNFFKKECAN
jgi:hypothetical protein